MKKNLWDRSKDIGKNREKTPGDRRESLLSSVKNALSWQAAVSEGGSGQNRKKKRNYNREIIVLTYLFAALLVGMLLYYAYFISMKSDDIINNPYNKRQELLAERVRRGKILGSRGEALAETKVDKNGREYRYYPYDNIFCHVVGRFTNTRTGVEQMQNINLLTTSENTLALILHELKGEKSRGNDVVTTLDVALQKTAYEALGNRRGAVVALEPSTGKVLAMVSRPDYNPNTVSEHWNSLVEDKEGNSALLNRASQGLYPPGSTFKILTALEYIRENDQYSQYEYDCKGSGTFQGVKINCYGNEVHGKENLTKSFAKSCNASFAQIGMSLKLKSFRALCDRFLFNRALPTDIPYSKSSFVLKQSSDRSEIPQTAIGQGDTQISPLHNAMIASVIANEGVLMKPYVVDALTGLDGEIVREFRPEEYASLITKDQADIVKQMMEEVVKGGTASSLSDLPYLAAGKTGSAEFDSSGSSHAWFVGFAPADDPKIVVSIIVEGAGTGSKYAAPIARKMFESYLN